MNLVSKICLFLVCLFLAFSMGRISAPKEVVKAEKVRVDTLLVRDTITREMPVYRTNIVRDTITLFVHDTIPVYLPREVKIYEDSLYRAEVSGVFPSLDRIDIYQRKEIVTIEVEKQVAVPVRQRWGIGIQAGYGAYLYEQTIRTAPYIGVGLTYNIISW